MIDNYDSFTYNIVQYCRELNADLKIIRNDEMSVEEIERLNPEKIIISPGPASLNKSHLPSSFIVEVFPCIIFLARITSPPKTCAML